MPWNRVKKIRVTNIVTNESDVVLLPAWVKKNGFNTSSVYSVISRGGTYRGFKIEPFGYATVDKDGAEVTETKKKMIVNGYRSGMTILQIGNRFRLGRDSVRTILAEAGYDYPLPTKPSLSANTVYPDYDIKDVGKLKALINAGWKENEIAYEFNTSVTKVREKMAEI